MPPTRTKRIPSNHNLTNNKPKLLLVITSYCLSGWTKVPLQHESQQQLRCILIAAMAGFRTPGQHWKAATPMIAMFSVLGFPSQNAKIHYPVKKSLCRSGTVCVMCDPPINVKSNFCFIHFFFHLSRPGVNIGGPSPRYDNHPCWERHNYFHGAVEFQSVVPLLRRMSPACRSRTQSIKQNWNEKLCLKLWAFYFWMKGCLH